MSGLIRSALSLCLVLPLLAGCATAPPPELPEGLRSRTELALPEPEFASEAELSAFAPPDADLAYRLGPGDRIVVDVWTRPELSGEHTIGPDGVITVPVSGALSISGLERDAAAAAIRQALVKHYRDPVVTLRVKEYAAHEVLVLGEVREPGMHQMNGPMHLLGALTAAGGLQRLTGELEFSLASCTVFRGRDSLARVNLKQLLRGGNLTLNIPLQRGDVVYVPEIGGQAVYVLGEVKTPGLYPYREGISFIHALAGAGGPTRDADRNRIFLIRMRTGTKVEIPLDRLLEPDPGLDIALENEDIIFVPPRGLAKFSYVMDSLGSASWLLDIGDRFYGDGYSR